MPRAVLGLGTNLGARRAIFSAAWALFAAQPGCRVLGASRLYETPPLGPPQPDYLNAALLVDWVGGAEALFFLARHVEALLGRERRERWGARTLDVDMLAWSEGPVHTPELEVPHPALRTRNFALAPLLDVLPELASSFGADLEAAGGAPRLATPGWLRSDTRAGTLDMHVGDEAELVSGAAALMLEAHGTAARARSVLPFRVPRARDLALAALAQRIGWACAGGFAVCCAAVTRIEDDAFSGVLVGEQVGHCAPWSAHALPVVARLPDGGFELALSLSPPL